MTTLHVAIIRSPEGHWPDYADASADSDDVAKEAHDLLGGGDDEVVGIWPVEIINGSSPTERLEEAFRTVQAMDDLCDEARMRDLCMFFFARGFNCGERHKEQELQKALGLARPSAPTVPSES